MIVQFPDLHILQLALTTGAVPHHVAQKPALAGFGKEGQVWIETAAKLPSVAQRELSRLGAFVCKSSDTVRDTRVSCWLELLPLVRDDMSLGALEKMPVLFDLPSDAEWLRLVLEMLRLGNDRQSYRWLEERSECSGLRPCSEGGRVLLRVIGPPYYSLLRAVDSFGNSENMHAFVEQTPGVWVEVGYRHPLSAFIRPPRGKILLLRAPRQWQVLPEGPFRDLYEIAEFRVPEGPTYWKNSSSPHRLTVTLRLRQTGPTEGAELWVLRGEAAQELHRFVQNAEDQLLHRLAFAVGEKDSQTIAVLRARPSKLPLPVLALPAEEYKRYLNFPNLFMPIGYTLHPPLRRDVIRKLLADDPGQITWLVPVASGRGTPPGSFIPEGLPEDAFRPLSDWVDYVLDCSREPLRAWVQAMQFQFESFVCDEEQPNQSKGPPSTARHPPSLAPSSPSSKDEKEPPREEDKQPRAENRPQATGNSETFVAVGQAEPSELEKEWRAVEEKFLTLPGGLDAPARQTLWLQLADLYTRSFKWEDAGICWLHVLWNAGECADHWADAWFRMEKQAATHNPQSVFCDLSSGKKTITDILDDLLVLSEPTTADLRTLAAYLTWSAQCQPQSLILYQRLPALQRFLEAHENLLPVRAVWLAWYHLAQLTGGDVLALARARDRLLERLFCTGLRPERDLPSFLRFAGCPDSRVCREVCEWLSRLCEKAHSWIEHNSDVFNGEKATKAYGDLLFAFGLARLGESNEAQRLFQRARKVLKGKDRVHHFLLAAFEERIQNVLAGKPHAGPLPSTLLEELESMTLLDRYVIERLCYNSRILEPERQVNPYRHWTARQSDLDKALVELIGQTDRLEIQTRLRDLLGKIAQGPAAGEERVKILRTGLELGPYLGEEFTCEILQQTLPTLDILLDSSNSVVLEERACLLEKALFAAGHFGCTEYVQPLIAHFRHMLHSQQGRQSADSLGALAEQSLRSLRKLGLHGDIERLLSEMEEVLLQRNDPDTWVRSFDPQKDALASLTALLHVAGSWYYLGRDHLAEPIVQAARTLLFSNVLRQAKQRRDLACAYARTVAQAAPAVALPRLEEIFIQLSNYRDTFTTSSHFCLVQLDLIEAVVLAVVHEDFMHSSQARRWLDEEEYLVRRRIHSDVRNRMTQT